MENGLMTRDMVSLETMENERVGRGVFTFSDGDVYEGESKDGKLHGKF